MYLVIILLIIWTWSLTPLWVNLLISVLAIIKMTISMIKFIIEMNNYEEK
jgi:hypothetical protein